MQAAFHKSADHEELVVGEPSRTEVAAIADEQEVSTSVSA